MLVHAGNRPARRQPSARPRLYNLPMLRVLSVLCLVLNTGAGLALILTRGGILGQAGLPPPLPFYADLMGVFLLGSGVGFIPAVLAPQTQRPYLWVFGVGVKLAAAMLFARLVLSGLVGWLVGVAALVDGAIAVLFALALWPKTK
jgi:hypothetical protein